MAMFPNPQVNASTPWCNLTRHFRNVWPEKVKLINKVSNNNNDIKYCRETNLLDMCKVKVRLKMRLRQFEFLLRLKIISNYARLRSV